jgi:hypothetical protein
MSSHRGFTSRNSTTSSSPRRLDLAAIKSVSADQIALFNVLTAIRRLGRSGRRAFSTPNQQPILDVAATGFFAVRTPHEVVLDRGRRATGDSPPSSFTPSFKALVEPVFARR